MGRMSGSLHVSLRGSIHETVGLHWYNSCLFLEVDEERLLCEGTRVQVGECLQQIDFSSVVGICEGQGLSDSLSNSTHVCVCIAGIVFLGP